MGQHKMEKDFAKKLNQREITPTANAWDRLDAMLTVAEETKPKRDFGWLYMAAAILGFLFLAALYFKNIPEVKDVPRNNVVIENQPEKPSEDKKEIVVPNADNQSVSIPKAKSEIRTPKHKPNPINENREIIAQNPKENQSSVNQQSQISQQPPEPIEKADKLANAENQSAIRKTSITVDAKNLLSQAEEEVSLPFREKMLRKINKNCRQVAQAVSNRNIQQ